jgi:hypothetical protein
MTIRTKHLLAAAVVAALLGGCDYDVYEIEMSPRGGAIRRTLTAWHVAQGDKKTNVQKLAEEKLAALAKLYDKRLTGPEESKQAFAGTFGGRTPDDVGGAGYYNRLDSRMGHASIYSERFRGRDDQASVIEEGLKKIDKAVDHLIKWLESELAGEKGFRELRKFLDEDFRRDVKNFFVYAWMGRLPGAQKDKSGRGQELTARVLQYFAERGYFSPEQLPAIARAVIEAFNQDSPEGLLAIVQRFLATKMGVPADKPVPGGLAFLADPNSIEHSMESYARTTDEFKARMRQWEQDKKADPNTAEPNPADVLELPKRDLPILKFDLFGPSRADQLTLKLETGVKPWTTNGTWDKDGKLVEWSAALSSGDKLPVQCYALWAGPNEPFQARHFGKVVLEGHNLTAYCLWRSGLRKDEAKEWEAFVDTLKPGGGLKEKLQAFRFSREAPPDPKARTRKTHARAAIDLIVGQLPPAAKAQPPDGD